MKKFKSARAKQIFDQRWTKGVPASVGTRAHRIMHLLTSATSIQDVGVIGVIVRGKGDRFSLLTEGKWYVTFRWDDYVGALDIDVERR